MMFVMMMMMMIIIIIIILKFFISLFECAAPTAKWPITDTAPKIIKRSAYNYFSEDKCKQVVIQDIYIKIIVK
jgi:hypothetical protein